MAQRGVIKAISQWVGEDRPVLQIDQVLVHTGRGIEGDRRGKNKRGLTLLSTEQWAETCRELGVDLPWTARRANVLVEGVDLKEAAGRTVTLGEVRIYVYGETRPCALMDRTHQGLRAALMPDWRGGVHGEVLTGGTLRVGDTVTVLQD